MSLATLSRWWEWSWLDGIASLYAGDRYARMWLPRVYDGLKDHYAVSEEDLRFFTVVQGDLVAHLEWEVETLSYWACTTERQLAAARAFRTRLDLEEQMLIATQHGAQTGKPQYQVP